MERVYALANHARESYHVRLETMIGEKIPVTPTDRSGGDLGRKSPAAAGQPRAPVPTYSVTSRGLSLHVKILCGLGFHFGNGGVEVFQRFFHGEGVHFASHTFARFER